MCTLQPFNTQTIWNNRFNNYPELMENEETCSPYLESLKDLVQDPDSRCCFNQIPQYDLRSVRYGMEQLDAKRNASGSMPGEGETFNSSFVLGGAQRWDDRTNGSYVSDALYNSNNFLTLSGVGDVYVGTFIDPYTGEEYDEYENAMAPPDVDYTEMVFGANKGRVLHRLQGDTKFKVERREHELGNDYMHYHQPINMYGVQDRRLNEDVARFNNRFAPTDASLEQSYVDQIPANMVGNQGVQRVRYMPAPTSTYRGYVSDPISQRTGVHARVDGGWSENVHTRRPLERAVNIGMEAGVNSTFTTQTRVDTFQVPEAMRDEYHHLAPVRAASRMVNDRTENEWNAPTNLAGLDDVPMEAIVQMDTDHSGLTGARQAQERNTARALAGLDIDGEEIGLGMGAYTGAEHRGPNPYVDTSTVKSGMDSVFVSGGAKLYDNYGGGLEARDTYHTASVNSGMDSVFVSGGAKLYDNYGGGLEARDTYHTASELTKRQTFAPRAGAQHGGPVDGSVWRMVTTRMNEKLGKFAQMFAPGMNNPYVDPIQENGSVTQISNARSQYYINGDSGVHRENAYVTPIIGELNRWATETLQPDTLVDRVTSFFNDMGSAFVAPDTREMRGL
jgi:hypothetical protein